MKNSVGEFQTILVLGGRSDIGSAIAGRVATSFTKKIVLAGRNMTDVDADRLREAMQNRGSTIPEISCAEFDARDFSKHAEFFTSFAKEPLDLVIFAFGQLGEQNELFQHPVQAAELVSVNMTGVVSSALACATHLKQQGSGHMLFVSSVAGVRTRKSNFIYGASKSGMDAFAQGLGDELEDSGVRVTIVRPGFVHSSMTSDLDPAPFAASVESVAEAVAVGMRRGTRVIWVPNLLRYVFSILRVLPTPIWRRLPIN